MLRAKPAFPPSLAVRGYPLVHLLAAGIIAVMVSGCAAPIRESQSALDTYVNVYVAEFFVGESDISKPAVNIMDIQRVGEPDTRYTPSPSAHNLWLRSGTYEATLECFRPQKDPYNIPILKEAAPPDPDGKVRFTIESHEEFKDPYTKGYIPYEIDCATSAESKPAFVIMPVPTDTGV